MNKTKKRFSIVIILSLFWLFSISPVLAEEPTGSIDESSGVEAAVVETVVEIPNTDEEVVETIIEIPSTNESVIETVVEIPDTDGAVVETVVEIPDTDRAVVETVVEIPGIDEESEYLDSAVLNVIIPVTVSVTIDPLELAGKGQVYSNIYNIKNNGDTDVLLTFTDIEITFADDTGFEASPHPFVEKIGSNLKAIYMMLDFGREDVPPAIITDLSTKSAVSIPLSTTQGDMAENSLVQFNFSGNVNEASALNWHDNDVTISLNYTLEPVLPPVEVEIPLTTETAIEIPFAEEVTPPAEQVTPPAEEVPPPAEEVTPPAEEVTPPAEEVTPPAEEVTPPAEEVTPPADEVTPPADEVTPPAESGATESPPESASPEADPST